MSTVVMFIIKHHIKLSYTIDVMGYNNIMEKYWMRPERYAKWGCHQPSRVGMSFYGIRILINVDIIRYQSSLPLSPETFLKTIVEGRNSSKHHFRSPK